MSALRTITIFCVTLLAMNNAMLVPNDVAAHFGIPTMDLGPHEHQVRGIPVQTGMGVRDLRMTSCGPNDLVKIGELTISSDLKLTGDVQVLSQVKNSSLISVDIEIKKQLPILGFKTIHTHHFDDLCSFAHKFADKCATNTTVMKDNNIPCACPVPQGKYAVKQLPLMPLATQHQGTIRSFVTNGNYFAKVTMKQDNKVIACQTVTATVQV